MDTIPTGINNNYAYAGMLVDGAPISSSAPASYHGADITAIQINDINWWRDTAFRVGQAGGMSAAAWANMQSNLPTGFIQTSLLLDTAEITVTASEGGLVSLVGGLMLETPPWADTHSEELLIGFDVTVMAKPFDDYDFIGWQNKDGDFVSFDLNFTFEVTEDVILYAIFKQQDLLPDPDTDPGNDPDNDPGDAPDADPTLPDLEEDYRKEEEYDPPPPDDDGHNPTVPGPGPEPSDPDPDSDHNSDYRKEEEFEPDSGSSTESQAERE